MNATKSADLKMIAAAVALAAIAAYGAMGPTDGSQSEAVTRAVLIGLASLTGGYLIGRLTKN